MANILHWLQFAVGLAPWLGYSKIQYVAYGFRKPAFGNLSAVDFGPFSKEIGNWLAGWLAVGNWLCAAGEKKISRPAPI